MIFPATELFCSHHAILILWQCSDGISQTHHSCAGMHYLCLYQWHSRQNYGEHGFSPTLSLHAVPVEFIPVKSRTFSRDKNCSPSAKSQLDLMSVYFI